MRRLILILAMLCATLGAFAYTDSFTSLTHDPAFLALLDVVKNGGTEDEAQAAYEAYIATEPSMLDASRANYHMVRYYMDNGEFTNGFAYRNCYAHGCIVSESDTEKHHIAYLVFLRLLTILILKIEDDLWCATRAFVTGTLSHSK